MAEFAGVDCLTTVYPIGEAWIGKSTSGQVQKFNTLDDYKQFLSNLAASGKVCPDASVPQTTRSENTTRTPHTGFLEFLPRNSKEQSRYSAMSPSWEGQAASDKAIISKKFAEEEVFFYKPSDTRFNK
jgi:hypothetical protein